MNEIQKYIAAHEPKMMDDLFSLIRIPSISALPEHHDDMLACAERWHNCYWKQVWNEHW